MKNAKPYHSKIYHSCHSDTLRHSEGCKPEESTLLCHSERSEESKNIESQNTESRCFAFAQHDNPCHSEDFPPCHSDLERSEREESQNTESKKESESTKDKYDFQR